MDKIYLENQYQQIVREWRCADENERWALRSRMVKLEQTAGETFGCDYMDDLHNRYTAQMK